MPCISAFRKALGPNEPAMSQHDARLVTFLTERFAAFVRSGRRPGAWVDRTTEQPAPKGWNGSSAGMNVTTFGGGLSKRRQQVWKGHRSKITFSPRT
jgi:hypothetical protein